MNPAHSQDTKSSSVFSDHLRSPRRPNFVRSPSDHAPSDAKSPETSPSPAHVSLEGKPREILPKKGFCETVFFVYYTILKSFVGARSVPADPADTLPLPHRWGGRPVDGGQFDAIGRLGPWVGHCRLNCQHKPCSYCKAVPDTGTLLSMIQNAK